MLYALTIFLSAFLLFQVQPIIARTILPWFGGGASVWAACLLFFQSALLLGYLYSHFIAARLTLRRQWMLHTVLLASSLAVLPITPGAAWKPVTPSAPVLHILGLLVATVGLPYFLLSTTGPLIQSWFTQRHPDRSPYRLYALSNLGSLLALLSYPVLVEPEFTVRSQGLVWSAGFAVFAVLCVWTGWRSQRGIIAPGASAPRSQSGEQAGPEPKWQMRLFWALLAACPSMMLLALTSHITTNLAPIPLLWILPLAIYLLSFILCFDAQRWYRRKLFLALLAPALGFAAWLSYANRSGVLLSVGLLSVCFFISCIVCHGELARLKPHPLYLTGFYLMLSVGGAAGGVFVGFLAPTLFNAYYELPISIVLCAVLGLIVAFREEEWVFHRDPTGLPSCIAFTFIAVLIAPIGGAVRVTMLDSIYAGRNFYGCLTVRLTERTNAWKARRTLAHGTTTHGEQFTHPARRRQPTAYYCPDSGIGRLLEARAGRGPQRGALVGLGAGVLAAYGRPGDSYTFYEINPLIADIARNYFTYLRDSRAATDIRLGDARLSLEREAPQHYDFIAVDAFSGDSVPTHLLTLEALRLYLRHLAPGGVLAVHISNRYLNLEPVLERGAHALGWPARLYVSWGDPDSACTESAWVLLAGDETVFAQAGLRAGVPLRPAPWLSAWTDDFSNVFVLLGEWYSR